MKNIIKLIYGIGALLLLFSFSGCGAVTKQHIAIPSTKKVDSQKSRIIMKRDGGKTASGGCEYEIKYNNISVGTIAMGDTLRWDVPSGDVVFTATKTTLCGGRNFSTKNYTLNSGVTYSFLFTSGLDFNKGTIILVSNDETIQKELTKKSALINQKQLVKEQQKAINNYLSNNNLQGLKLYTEKNPNK